MQIVDMLIHPVFEATESDLFDLEGFPWERWFGQTLSRMDANGVHASGVCIMDAEILDRPDDLVHLREAMAGGRFWFTFMPNLRRADAELQIEKAALSGFQGLTWHSYLQEIGVPMYERVAELSAQSVALGMFNGVCTAHGSKRVYQYHSLPLAVGIAEVAGGATVLYHAGGYKINEVLALCDMWENLLIETSFSLSYWLGSSIENDLAFAMKKIGVERVLFGSDSPFVPLEKSLSDHAEFFARHGFSEADQNQVWGGTARRVFPFIEGGRVK